MVGAWFAANDSPSSVGALIGVHSYHLGGTPGDPLDNDYDDVIAEAEGREYPQAWQPSSVTPRVAAQHSQFLFSSVSSRPSGSLWLPDTDHNTWVIAITPDLKGELLGVLDRVFDISYQTLFPDLSGFAYSESHHFKQFSYARW
jgi:hypothetical protein